MQLQRLNASTGHVDGSWRSREIVRLSVGVDFVMIFGNASFRPLSTVAIDYAKMCGTGTVFLAVSEAMLTENWTQCHSIAMMAVELDMPLEEQPHEAVAICSSLYLSSGTIDCRRRSTRLQARDILAELFVSGYTIAYYTGTDDGMLL